MNIKKWLSKVVSVLFIVLVAGGLAACSNNPSPAESAAPSEAAIAKTGVLIIRVNPEVAVHYDDKGMVTKLAGQNDDGNTIVEKMSDFEGKEVRDVVKQLVTAIGEAGFFVEEVAGEARKVTIELERGSVLPSEQFLSDIVSDVRDVVNSQGWQAPVASPAVETQPVGDDDFDDDNLGDDVGSDFHDSDDAANDHDEDDDSHDDDDDDHSDDDDHDEWDDDHDESDDDDDNDHDD